jgi:hypothetical protein
MRAPFGGFVFVEQAAKDVALPNAERILPLSTRIGFRGCDPVGGGRRSVWAIRCSSSRSG